MPKKLTQEEFISRCTEVHGGKYDYSLVKYENCKIKIEIICLVHGVFQQNAKSHIQGIGCAKCVKDSQRGSTEEFIRKAKEMHADRYDYTLVYYRDRKAKVKIICSEHGVFEQSPCHHLNGNGCAKCSQGSSRSSTEEFIKEAKLVHSDRYNYDSVKYIDSNTKVEILCYTHEKFLQTPNNHLVGKGCPKCRKSKGENIARNKLQQWGLIYEQEYSPFDRKRYDFLVHHSKKTFLLEYDGEQHFVPANFGSTKVSKIQKYEKTVKSDCEKNLFAATYNIPLYRIHYKCNVEVAMNTLINHFNSNTPSPGTGVFMCLPAKDNKVEVRDIVDYLMYPDETTP